MILSPARNTTTGDLLRVLAWWLCCVLALQGLQAARALAQGPLHRHVAAARAGHAHAHAHADAQRHVHLASQDTATTMAADDGLAEWDAVAFAITAALALMALGRWPGLAAAGCHVLRAAAPWQALAHWPGTPERPPRAA